MLRSNGDKNLLHNLLNYAVLVSPIEREREGGKERRRERGREREREEGKEREGERERDLHDPKIRG